MKKSSIIWITTGVILVLVGMTALLTLPLIILKIVDKEVVIAEDSPSFTLWRDLPLPIYQRFYFFNVTNAVDVQQSGAVPHLQQIGPFVYFLDIKKHDINFTDSGQRVSFNERMSYHFVREQSVDDLSLKITTVNAPLAVALSLMEELSPLKRALVSVLLNHLNEDFFIERSIKELLFDGYPDLLTKLAPYINPKIPHLSSFGWMYNRNNSNDGLFVVKTGKTDINHLNSIESLNGLSALTYWSGDECNSFRGATNAEAFNPLSSDHKSLRIFRTDLCRVWSMDWQSAITSRFGDLSVYRYSPADNTFANSSVYPPNSCYKENTNNSLINFDVLDNKFVLSQMKKLIQNDPELIDSLESTLLNLTKNFGLNSTEVFDGNYNLKPVYREFPSGVFDLSACHYDAPTFISNPHFFKADPHYLKTVSGLVPNASIHQTLLDIEPITGTPIELELRLQLNVFINPMTKQFKQYRRLPEIHFPVFWQEFSIHVTDKIAHDLHWTLTAPSMIATIISVLFVFTGSLTLIFIVTKPLLKSCGRRQTADADNNNVESDTSALVSNADAIE